MIEMLPRQMLWSDFSTINRFYDIEPLNKKLHEVLKTIDINLFGEKKDDTVVFNEVYYMMTRMVYERAMPSDVIKYEVFLREDMGSYDMVELVMSMIYFLMSLAVKDRRLFNSFLPITIKERYERSPYWKPFYRRYVSLSKGKRRLTYDFSPRPVKVQELADKFIRWQELTHDYNAGALLEILNLWNSDDDRRLLIEMIGSSVKYSTPKIQQNYYNQVEPILEKSLFEKKNDAQNNSALEERLKKQDETIMLLKKENSLFQNLIRELQGDNERMKSLLDEDKQDGLARKIMLGEIVKYCKGCVEWKNAEPIVMMLNRILRQIATEEDYKQIDSIEQEFKNRAYGNVTMNNPQFSGPMYNVTGNENVNIGENGEENE